MAEVISWSELAAAEQKKLSSGLRRLTIDSGGSCRIRFVGNPVRYHKYFVNNRTAICGDPAKCPIRTTHNIEPVVRYAINVLDRDEPNLEARLKILDVPHTFIRQIVAWINGNPGQRVGVGGVDGSDFTITKNGSAKTPQYLIHQDAVTPFTEEEKKYLVANLYDLEKLFAQTPPEKIELQLFSTHSNAVGK